MSSSSDLRRQNLTLTVEDILSDSYWKDDRNPFGESFDHARSCIRSLAEHIDEAGTNVATQYEQLSYTRTNIPKYNSWNILLSPSYGISWLVGPLNDLFKPEYDKHNNLAAKMRQKLTNTLKTLTDSYNNILKQKSEYRRLYMKFAPFRTNPTGANCGVFVGDDTKQLLTSMNACRNKIEGCLVGYNLDLAFVNKVVRETHKDGVMMDGDFLSQNFHQIPFYLGIW